MQGGVSWTKIDLKERRVIFGGKVQEGFGRVTGDAKTQAEGVANQVRGDGSGFIWSSRRHSAPNGEHAGFMVARKGRNPALHDGCRCLGNRLADRSNASASLKLEPSNAMDI